MLLCFLREQNKAKHADARLKDKSLWRVEVAKKGMNEKPSVHSRSLKFADSSGKVKIFPFRRQADACATAQAAE